MHGVSIKYCYVKTLLIVMKTCVDPSSTSFANCEEGSVRLAESSIDEDDQTIEGRVEVCVNNAWGTVCNHRFSQEDAGTFCVQYGGYLREGVSVVSR